jgi:inosose dehydratase
VRAEQLDFVTAVKIGTFVRLGDGTIDLDRIFGALRGSGYEGWIIVEQDAAALPFEAARANRAYLRRRFEV